jgi:hypothetical protein
VDRALSRQAEEPRSTIPVEPKVSLSTVVSQEPRPTGIAAKRPAPRSSPLVGPTAEQEPAAAHANATPRARSSGQEAQSRGGEDGAMLDEPPRAQRPETDDKPTTEGGAEAPLSSPGSPASMARSPVVSDIV